MILAATVARVQPVRSNWMHDIILGASAWDVKGDFYEALQQNLWAGSCSGSAPSVCTRRARRLRRTLKQYAFLRAGLALPLEPSTVRMHPDGVEPVQQQRVLPRA